MNDIVQIERVDEIGLICLNKPPVNALGVALRTATFEALKTLLSDINIKAIVLYGEGRFFSAGADIKDFSRAAEIPTLPDLLNALNDSPKPVVAAMHGVAFGGALELAMAAHLRVAVAGLKIALPEVKLGLLPGAGGTQRLTRLTGIAAAIDIICTGRNVADNEALELGILARVGSGTARDLGIVAAREVLNGGLTATPTDTLTVVPDPTSLESSRKRFVGKLNAPMKALDAIEAASLAITQGMARERALFMELMQGEERAGLVHAFFAERATTKIPESSAEVRDITSIAVVGGGTMGVGIATSALLANLPVTLIESAEDRVANARAAVEKNLSGALARGKLTEKSHQEALKNLTTSADIKTLSNVDLVIEAIFEDMQAKISLFAELDIICKPGAILASNTSYLDVNVIASATSRASDVIGLHFFSPAHIMRLLEVVVADETADEVVATAFALAKTLRKIPVRANVCDGFIGNRILTKYRKLCEYLVLDGADFDQLDRALETFGFALGPFAIGDLAGLDIAKATRDRKAASRPASERYSSVADLICDQGWYGRKTERGYYLYENGKKKAANPGAVEIVETERLRLGIVARDFSDDDIVARAVTAMIQEAAMILEEGIALRPVDIDAIQLFGYGFPRHRGGPMHLADQTGLDEIISRIETWAKEDDVFWQVPKLLHTMKAKGQTFAGLNEDAS